MHPISEARVALEPVLPVRLYQTRNVLLANIGAFAMGYVFLAVTYEMSVFFQIAHGLSPTNAGLSILPMTIGFTIMTFVAGMTQSALGRYVVVNHFCRWHCLKKHCVHLAILKLVSLVKSCWL